MRNSTTNNDIAIGDIAFYDNYIPSLNDSEYMIKISTNIQGIDTEGYFDNDITQNFEVRGPQFSLPATDVHSVYPPLNSNSKYDKYLPNIVLSKRVLPWERNFSPNDKTIPWVCLLIFAEGEITLDSQTNSPLITSTVSEFLTTTDDVMKPNVPLNSIPSDVLASNCSSIQITKEVFDALAPKIEELKYLSHVRQVNTGDQAIIGYEDVGWFSVITGNRLLISQASTGTRYYVHMVSLEGYFDIMSGSTAWPMKTSDPTQPKDIALASLYNWTFLSQPDTLNFSSLVENFVSQGATDPDNALLRLYINAPQNPDGPTQAMLTRLENGYIPLNYNTNSGETTFTWYRGPLTPVIAQPLPRPSDTYHYPSSSSMMIYDKTTGIFDQSYAAAWSIGRSLALSDGTFTQDLRQYRKKSYNLVGMLLDALKSAGDASSTDLSEVINSSVVRDEFKKIVNSDLGTTLTRLFTNKIPVKSTHKVSPTTTETADPVDVVKSFLEEPTIQAFLQDEVQNDLIPVVEWLAQLQLLYNIPFNHLVPDQLELPVESLRFFYVDQNWLNSLVDGALSIGVQNSKDSFFNEVMGGVIKDAVTAEIKFIRSKLLGTSTGDTEPDSTQEAISGILIRSEVVSGWPGLVIKGYKGDLATGTQLKTLRIDRLSANVLLCLFLDIPDTIILAEPQQGLCFGLEDNNIINLRQLTDPIGKPTGKDFPSSGGFEIFYRPTTNNVGNNVLNINDGTTSVVQTMETPEYLNTSIGSAQFALEMVKSPEEVSFTNSSNS